MMKAFCLLCLFAPVKQPAVIKSLHLNGQSQTSFPDHMQHLLTETIQLQPQTNWKVIHSPPLRETSSGWYKGTNQTVQGGFV